MEALNWLLLNAGDAAMWLWAHVKFLFAGLWWVVDRGLNPVLSPVQTVVNPIATAGGDAVYAVLGGLPPWLHLTILSMLLGVVMLLAFRYTSNQDAIGRAKDDIKANLLALKLYKDDLRITLLSQLRVLGAVVRLQRYVLTPVLIFLFPMLWALAQMGLRHQWRPLTPGERTLVRVTVSPSAEDTSTVTLVSHEGVRVEAGPIPGGGELVWRVRAIDPGRHVLKFRVGGRLVDKEILIDGGPASSKVRDSLSTGRIASPTAKATGHPTRIGARDTALIEKEIVIGGQFQRVSAVRPARDWTSQLLHPAERPLPADGPIRAIEIEYPGADSWVYGSNMWVVYLFVVSMLTALILRPVFGVRF